jgi:hypothetical protein
MHSELAPFTLWRAILLADAALTGVEAPALVFLGALRRRPAFELLLAAAPSLVCFWALSVARAAESFYSYWLSYFAFQLVHYPPPYLPPSTDGLAPAAAEITRLGWEVGAATILALTLGWALLLRWCPRPARVPQ